MSGNGEKNLTDLVKSLNDRVTALERTAQISDPKPFYRSIKQPSHYLEASSKVMTEDGLTTETTVPICAICHSPLGDKYSLCHHCDRVLCEACSVLHNNRTHCEECLRSHHLDISKRHYLVLICAANDITKTEDVNQLTAILPKDIEDSMKNLRLANLITTEAKLFGLIHETKLTDDGFVAINTYRQVYGKHEDVATFGRKLRTLLSEKTEV